jgi:diadenosine tetraphosphate (Ap4A) HIT family hydrolase
MSFELHPRIAADTVPLGDLMICRVLMMNDARYPWLMLVPRRPNLTELFELAVTERAILMEEIATVSIALKELTQCRKLNIATLGNVVSQLHVHVVARFEDDGAWPDPVWGNGRPQPYLPEKAQEFAGQVARRLEFI